MNNNPIEIYSVNNTSMDPILEKIPKIIFIVPYRDREEHQRFFKRHMEQEILSIYQKEEYKIYYIHQNDKRDFNRGALKNIGFKIVKEKFPNNYKKIILIFNDVDTMPFNKNFLNYETNSGVVKHFYGYKYALGGIVSIVAEDFESVNGYPNLWAWGFEDNMLQQRVLKNPNLSIDRTQFYPILDKNILQLNDGLARMVNRKEFDRYINNTIEGINSITDLNYEIDENSGFVHVNNFKTGHTIDNSQSTMHDLRKGNIPYKPHDFKKKNTNMSMLIVAPKSSLTTKIPAAKKLMFF